MKIGFLVSISALATSAFSQIDPNAVVATINGEDLRGSEYFRRMEHLSGVGKRQGNTFGEFPPGFLTIEQIITERLVFQLAREKGVFPSDLEVQAEYRARLEDQPNFLELWKTSGRTEEELLYQVRYELAQFRIQTFGVTITDQQIEKEYADNPGRYTIPRQLKLRVIVVENEEGRRAVDAALAAGRSFADVARERSVDVTKPLGGDFGTVPVTMFQQQMRTAFQGVGAGQMTQWITSQQEGQSRQVRFLVEQIIPEEKLALDARLKRRIRREMLVQRGSVRNNIERELREVRRRATINIKNPAFARAYQAYVEAYLRTAGTN